MRKVICEQLDVAPDAVQEGASFIDDLGADSLAIVELVLALEEQFGVNIPDEEAERLRTVGDALNYVLTRAAPAQKAAGA
jgi:acyl carrier protein